MFDIGFSELFLVAVVALIVLGPERLPRAARFAGLWVRRAKAQWYSVKSELETELADEELRRSLRATEAELRAARAQLHEGGQALQRSFAPDAAAAHSEPTSPERTPPGPVEPGPSGPVRRDPQPGDAPQGDPDPDAPERREPGSPPPERRDPDPAPDTDPGHPGDPPPGQHVDGASDAPPRVRVDGR